MEKIIIKGGQRLKGKVKVAGAKNAVLPVIAASLSASEGKSIIKDVPVLADVYTINEVLRNLNAEVNFDNENETVTVDATGKLSTEAPFEYVRKMRASVLVLGPLLARYGHANVKGRLQGAKIYLDMPSVGATENIMMAAALADGTSIIENSAKEPEIVDLANYLNKMGAKVVGAGTETIRIEGVEKLYGATHSIIPDRVEAGTFMVAAAITGGNVLIENAESEHLRSVISKLEEMDVLVKEEKNGLRVIGPKKIKPTDIKTLPHPGFPTDMQSQMMALMLCAEGTSVITETVFENRFMHVEEFRRMNAQAKIEGRSVIVEGPSDLQGAEVAATDLRAGAALILAGLRSKGVTRVTELKHLDRGYVDFTEKLAGLGANIHQIVEKSETANSSVKLAYQTDRVVELF